MPITINGSGTVTGISAGGLPDDCITTADIAANAVTYAKIGTTEQGQLCKAWVNFNGTGTVAIRASYNVSSITDHGVGDYTVNFANALADASYCVCAANNFSSVAPSQPASWSIPVVFGTRSTPFAQAPISSGFRIISVAANDFASAGNDCGHMMISIFR
jgi:hypothetical protein